MQVGTVGKFFHPKTLGVMHLGRVEAVRGDRVKVRFFGGLGTHWTYADMI